MNGTLLSNGINLSLFDSNINFYLMESDFNYTVLFYSTASMTTGQWYHIAVTWDGSTRESMKLYIDGVSVGIRDDTGNINTTGVGNPSTSFRIGNWGDTPSRYFKGSIDEVHIWKVAHTQDQIRENMHLTLKGSETGLVAYYQFNEDSGDAIDKVAGNNGTLNGEVTRVESQVAVAGGTSKTVNVTSGSVGTYEVDLSTTNMAIDFGTNHPNGELVIFRLNQNPYEPPTGVTSTSRYWVVRNFGTTISDLDINEVTFQIPIHNEISSTDENNPTNLRVHKRGSTAFGTWNLTDAMAVSASNTSKQVRFNTGSSSDFQSFSQFIITTDGNSSLPITLLSFNAKRANEREVLLTWATALEKDNAGFEIEMSADGENFEQVGFVEGAGNSSEVISYEFLVNSSNAAYYRLKQMDFDGSFEYSDLRFIEGVEITRSLSIAPNPSTGQVRLSLSSSPLGSNSTTSLLENEGLVLRLLDSKGQAVLNTEGTLIQVNEALTIF